MGLIKINDLLNLKEGEVYWGNVPEKERPRILEAYKNYNAEATTGDVSIEQANLPLCGPDLCNPFVPFCLTASAPLSACGIQPFDFNFGFDSCCVQCVVEPCLLPNASVTNPCDPAGPPISGCEVAVNRVRAVGSIRATAGIFSTPNCGGGTMTSVADETFCVNNVICFTCEENPCPDFCTSIGFFFTSAFLTTNPCGSPQATITGFLVLPSCV
ncbi:hypothetical protein [Priestia megaterium]|uniref:hypothetical protein n=1 Tax=Priestia megaterium TaxID=1404 RepID=UPI0022B8BB58|nr:hypothetical protein [Priestia megaterium]MCZ8497509.1 hypothetical protein [Priestia megaterium]